MLPIDVLSLAAAVVGATVVALVMIAWLMARLYQRATKELSFVRTGVGGQRVVMNGGALVFPVFHETIPVNMNTLRLEVRRAEEQALITADRMRVDVRAEFYVRVKPTEEAIGDAAQTLGRRTMNPEALKDLVEGKFVDALRAVAAEMQMEELHEQRVQFVQRVQTAVSEDLLKNGLELESVSLTALDQTDRSFFNPDNAFDAQGLTKLTEQIEARRKQRNEIEQDTEVAVRTKNLEAERQKLELEKQTEYAKLEQQREVEVRRAEQVSDVAKQRADREREAEQAQIVARQKVDQARISSEREVEEERIQKEQLVRARQILKERTVETASIEKQKTLELAEQDRAIAIAERSRSQSEAQAEADRARSLAVEAEEAVVTVRERARADRIKQIQLVEASQAAERDAIGVTVTAEADKAAAVDRAEAARLLAQGEADAVRIRAEADERRLAVEAEGKRALHEAENVLTPDVVAMRIKLALIEHLDAIIRESVRPMERIDGIKIVQIDGLAGGGAGAPGQAGAPGGRSLADDFVSAALRYRGQAPLVDALLHEVGLDGSSLEGLTRELRSASPGNGAAHDRDANAAPSTEIPS